ncbi:uncharacterized protein LOC131873976 [Cryptomeria japonica]|uniref:uncharacterized protein LOC131873976 n=1 Tax=Cryptomeria japonica TaxID=3369 RepID=UPI0027DAAC1B|nr:uncharacterized protein LOC131873976 [Cryptomeria japonica]
MASSSEITSTSSAANTQATRIHSFVLEITHAIYLTIVHPLPKITNAPIANPTPPATASVVSKDEPSAPPKENPPQPKRKRVTKEIVVSTEDESLDDPNPPPISRKPTQKRRRVAAKPSTQKPSTKASSAENPPTKEKNPQGEVLETKKRKAPIKRATPHAPKKTKKTPAEGEQAPTQSE